MPSLKFHKNRLKSGVTPDGDAFAALIDAMGGIYIATKSALLATDGGYAADSNNPTEGEFIVGGRIITGDGYVYTVLASGDGAYTHTNANAVRFLEVAHSPALLAGRIATLEGSGFTITVAANQTAFDAATPGPLELVVLYA